MSPTPVVPEVPAVPAIPAVPEPVVPAVVPPVVPEPVVPPADTTDWKVESRKWEDRAKANKDAADELQAIKDGQLSDQQKAEARATAAETRAAKSEAEAIRTRVAFEKGLTPAQEKRLVGSTRDELLADADALLADLVAPVAPVIPVPVPDPSIGPKAPAKPTGLSDAITAAYAS